MEVEEDPEPSKTPPKSYKEVQLSDDHDIENIILQKVNNIDKKIDSLMDKKTGMDCSLHFSTFI